MGLIVVAAWVATFAIGGVLQTANYFLSTGETTAAMALGGVALAIVGALTFYGLIKRKAWALNSFILLGVISIAQFYLIVILPMDEPGTAEWLRLGGASLIYTLVALFVWHKLKAPTTSELEG